MYAHLKDDKSSESEKSSNGGSSNGESNKLMNKRIRKRGSPELRESLIDVTTSTDDGEHDDLELGREPFGAGIDDPFYVFKEDLLRKLTLMDEELDKYLRVVRKTDTSVNTMEIRDTKKQLKRHIKNAESTLRDLQTTVRLVENKRTQFLHINDEELYERKSLVSSSADRIKRTKSDMNSDEIKSKMVEDERKKLQRRTGDMGAKTSIEKENSTFIQDKHSQAQLMLQAQDEALDELDEAVTRVGGMAGTINEELHQQNKMLSELEENLDDAEEKLGMVMGKLGKMLKTKNKYQLATIVCLSIAVVILFFLVVWT